MTTTLLRYRTLALLTGYLFALFILGGSLVDLGDNQDSMFSNEIYHLLAFSTLHILSYGILMFWFGQLYPPEHFARIATSIVIYGLLIECAQYYTGYRSFEFGDIVANTAGVLIGWRLCVAGFNRCLAELEHHLLKKPVVSDSTAHQD
jgi:hypothetical protein